MKKTAAKKGNPELIEALNAIEKEKDISKEILLEAIENSLVAACKNEYGKADNIRVNLDRETGEFHVYQDKVVVEEVEDAMLEMSQTEAEVKYPGTGLGETVSIEVTPKNFGRIAAQKAKQVVVQKIREEERKVLFEQYYEKEHDKYKFLSEILLSLFTCFIYFFLLLSIISCHRYVPLSMFF